MNLEDGYLTHKEKQAMLKTKIGILEARLKNIRTLWAIHNNFGADTKYSIGTRDGLFVDQNNTGKLTETSIPARWFISDASQTIESRISYYQDVFHNVFELVQWRSVDALAHCEYQIKEVIKKLKEMDV